MTIRDMETITGLTRANIRFYENQGLIAPERQENNYREYTDEHAQILLRIKLLRALGMSLEQIRALQSGSENLIAALDRQIGVLERQQDQLAQSQRVCREMRSDNVTYSTLDAKRYLSSLENPPRQTAAITYHDVEPRIFAPWQRYWARTLDSLLYACILSTAVTWLMKGQIPQWGNFLSTLAGFAMMLALEPVQLWLFGTTFGKWIFGITVADLDGRRLSLKEGFWRTVNVIIYGEGLSIPFVALWRNWKSYKAYEDGEYLPWDDPSELTVKDTKPVRYVAALLAAALIFGASIGLMTLAQLPENRADLTAAQFCENYRKVAGQNDWDTTRFQLNDDGTWTEIQQSGTVYIDTTANYEPLDLVFTEENGIVTSVTISEEITGKQEGWISLRTSQMRTLSLAFLMAQEDYSIFAGDEEEILTRINEQPFADFTLTSCGLEFRYDVEYEGYWTSADLGILLEDEEFEGEPYYAMTYTVTKVG